MNEDKDNFELKYLRAKDAIFRMIEQFCHCARNSTRKANTALLIIAKAHSKRVSLYLA